jgi:hypothetical protein
MGEQDKRAALQEIDITASIFPGSRQHQGTGGFDEYLPRWRMVQKLERVLSSRFTIVEIEQTPKALSVLDWSIG